MHKRRRILEEIANQLRTLDEFSVVWIQRVGPARQTFPSITIYAEREDVENLLIHPQPNVQNRTLIIAVNAWIRGTTDDEKIEQDMDDAAVAIETVMDLPTESEADDIILLSTEFIVDETDPEIHVVRLTYQLTYITEEFGAEV